ncbi:hypothetical protein JD844_005482 [Phrynosoma platyrhinos]|uniref:Peptidase C1A papain C-terminal domain-containing protein n=1 Tax=Phrynosoma platyrhinos TaxID=52577 RepID=A0ABQ7TPZ3_PHRPL|nr:hypothetical protein JD844_005482 [Phrynosoma platyrhinos]
MEPLRWMLLIFSLCPSLAEPGSDVSWKLPEFGDVYHVAGTIKLPFAEIEEPFEVWYNLTAKKSRIQYYDGQVVTYQVKTAGPWGANYKITPETTETEMNVRKCIRINGTEQTPVVPQSVFPTMDGFKPIRKEYYKGIYCSVWQNVSYWGTKKNVYTLWVSISENGSVPVHYEMRGINNLVGSHYDKCNIDYHGFSHSFLPSMLDLPKGAVTPVKDQAICGSCWSFAATGALEGALFLKTGQLTSLSQQALMDCSWGFGNFGCEGGLAWRAYKWAKEHGGIPSADSYGPYMGQNGYCHYNQSEFLGNVSGYVNVPYGNITALKQAVFKNGPIAVSINASPKSFMFYASGVYYDPECGNSTLLNHAVLVVGYGVLQGETYWLIKNSWSTFWGNDGYIFLSMKDNNCGVTNAALYPVIR